MRLILWTLAAAFFSVSPAALTAQDTTVPFGALTADLSLPVEVSADTLSVDPGDGAAIFEGNVQIGQGEMRLTAAMVRVQYGVEGSEFDGRITLLSASGGVTLVSGTEAAEADSAEYSIDRGQLILTGSVILTQGGNALSSDRAEINLTTGQARLDGRVRTILQVGDN